MVEKLEIGAGNSRLGPDWKTSDIRPGIADYTEAAWNIHLINGPNYWDELYACMVLEHIPRGMIVSTLDSWYNALKQGGALEVIVPSMKHIANVILGGNPEEGIRLAYGDQGYPEDTHVWGFTMETLQTALNFAGFKIVDYSDAQTLYVLAEK